MSHVVVTGATGHVGSRLIELLRERGVAVKALGRSAAKLSAAAAAGAEAVEGNLEDTDLLTKTFTGAAGVFALIPPSVSEPDFRAYQKKVIESLATALERAGAPRVVTLSSVGADKPSGTGPIAGLHLLEQRLNAIPGIHAVHLRPAYFMENHLNNLGLIKAQGINGSLVRTDVSLPMIATRDIAAAAAELLASPSFTGQSVRYLLGDRDYTMVEATKILGTAIGRPDLPYVVFPEEGARQAMLGMGLSPSLVGDYVEMSHGFNSGHVASESRTKENTTATSLEEFARTVFAPAFQAG